MNLAAFILETNMRSLRAEIELDSLKYCIMKGAKEDAMTAYKMINTEEYKRRVHVIHLIGSAVVDGNEDYTADDLGRKAIEALEAEGYEIVWLKRTDLTD